MEERKTLQFGRKYRVGNFFVLKVNKTLRKSEVDMLRDQMGIPRNIRKNLQRGQLPYIKVEAISGIWAVEFACTTNMYRFIDEVLSEAIEIEEHGLTREFNTVNDFSLMFSMMFSDTTILGDEEYISEKAKALKAFMDRQKAAEITDEEDRKILDEMQQDEEHKATILDMAKRVKEGGDDDE